MTAPGISALALVALAFLPTPAFAAFGFESLSSSFSVAGEPPGALIAGTHPESWSTALAFNSTGPPGERHSEGFLKDLHVELPVGLIADPVLLPQCSRADFLKEACPLPTAVGSIGFVAVEPLSPSTVFLLEPVPGEAAELGFYAVSIPVTIKVSISRAPPYGLIVSITNASQVTELFGATLRLEGTPNGSSFLTLPRSCADQLQTKFAASSWEDSGAFVEGKAPESQSLAECGSLEYAPSLKVTTTTTAASAPSGIDLEFDAPDTGLVSSVGRAAADTESAMLTLPPGLTLNPPVADGLAACASAQLVAEGPDYESGQGCPEASRLGSATVITPLIAKPVAGTIYLGEPEGGASAASVSESGTRLTLYLVLRDAERGVLVVVPIRVDADPATGRLTASFDQIPQFPVSHLELHFNSGPHAPLTTSATCGSEAFSYSLTPSSGNPPLNGSDSFVTGAPGCIVDFAPSLRTGTTSNAAGNSSDFVFELSQDAAAPSPSGFSVTLPSGLSAAFGAVTPCSDGQAKGGDCAADSKLGYARIALGSGPEPLWVPAGEQPSSAVYLAGPYKGAPFSLVIVVPGQAGPFDLGTVVLRAPITIDPTTAQASLSVEGLPQILDGVPLHYRTIQVVLDRPGFIRNPTSCEPTAITGTARAADGSTAGISARFQAADCTALSFKPRLALRFSGRVGRNGHPAVRAVVRGDPEGAAISTANIALPAGELLDLRHLRGLCRRDVAVDRCPDGSRLGQLRLSTPLLDEPLEGPVYLRVPRHRLPELSAEVRSGGLDFVVNGRTTAAHGRFGVALESMPDIPLTEAVLSLPGGHKGIIVNSRSLCGARKKVAATFTAHNGMNRRLSVPVRVAGCR